MEVLEGHYIRGFGDSQKPDSEIELLPGAVEDADALLKGRTESRERLERVSDLIAGFETPYGMELLSTVHWVGVHEQPAARDESSAAKAVQDWNERKRNMFHEHHVQVAWDRLKEENWIQ